MGNLLDPTSATSILVHGPKDDLVAPPASNKAQPATTAPAYLGQIPIPTLIEKPEDAPTHPINAADKPKQRSPYTYYKHVSHASSGKGANSEAITAGWHNARGKERGTLLRNRFKQETSTAAPGVSKSALTYEQFRAYAVHKNHQLRQTGNVANKAYFYVPSMQEAIKALADPEVAKQVSSIAAKLAAGKSGHGAAGRAAGLDSGGGDPDDMMDDDLLDNLELVTPDGSANASDGDQITDRVNEEIQVNPHPRGNPSDKQSEAAIAAGRKDAQRDADQAKGRTADKLHAAKKFEEGVKYNMREQQAADKAPKKERKPLRPFSK